MHKKEDCALTLTAIQEFRKFLDIMEEFIRNAEKERLSKLKECSSRHKQKDLAKSLVN